MNKIRLYELVLENGISASPYVWRIRYALAHKGLPCEPIAVGFTEISKILDGRFKTVPIIQHGQTIMAESGTSPNIWTRHSPVRPCFRAPRNSPWCG